MERLATSFDQARPFGTWADDLAAAFVQLEPRNSENDIFKGSIFRKNVDPIRVSRVIATKHDVVRLRSHIVHSVDDLMLVNLQLDGVGFYEQRGREQICGPGDLAFVDTTEPFAIRNQKAFKLFCFAIPRRLLPPAVTEGRPWGKVTTSRGHALSRTLAGYADLCLNSPSSTDLPNACGQHIVELISHVEHMTEQTSNDEVSKPVLLAMMLQLIDDNVSDPKLSALALAKRFKCSERYVHKLFSATGRSVGQHVNDRRVELCARNLLEKGRHRTIAEVAFEVGFRDVSYFNRVFKRAYGMAPRDFRRARAQLS